MKNRESNEFFRSYSKTISNTSYLKLLEKYILFEKTHNQDTKHKDWNKSISE
tara:strand:+ start:1816 stop:1971 length:156 start_codon:yes stop_codon:yes gene_type:complete